MNHCSSNLKCLNKRRARSFGLTRRTGGRKLSWKFSGGFSLKLSGHKHSAKAVCRLEEPSKQHPKCSHQSCNFFNLNSIFQVPTFPTITAVLELLSWNFKQKRKLRFELQIKVSLQYIRLVKISYRMQRASVTEALLKRPVLI